MTTLHHFSLCLFTLRAADGSVSGTNPRTAELAAQSSQSTSPSDGLRTSTAGRPVGERSRGRTLLLAVDRRTLPPCRFSWSSSHRTSRSRTHPLPSDLRSCTAPKHSRSRTQRLTTQPLPKEFPSDSQCVPCFQTPVRFYLNSCTAHLTRLSSISPHGREQHLNIKFDYPAHAHGQLIGIMAAIFWWAKAAIGRLVEL